MQKKFGTSTVFKNFVYWNHAFAIWDAIQSYVKSILEATLTKNKLDDNTKQWYQFLLDEKGGNFKYLRDKNPELTFDLIVDICTKFIYQASAGHSSVNFSQNAFYCYSPIVSLKLKGKAFDTEFNSLNDLLLNRLPPPQETIQINEVVDLLSTQPDLILGDFLDEHYQDKNLKQIAKDFQKRLKLIKDSQEYIYLNISNYVCQSVSI